MIEISYSNVMNGFNKGIHMKCLCPTRQEAERLFRNAFDLWYVKTMTICRRVDRTLEYGPEGFPRVHLQFQVFEATHNDSWRGFRGIFLLHPEITPENTMPRFQNMIEEMEWHNERHLEKWRA